MNIDRDLELISGLPVLYIKSLSAVVCSDLHLGYEGVHASRGVFIPKMNLNKIKDTLREAIQKSGAENIIVNGDIKNEFSEVHLEEFTEFREFIAFLRGEMKVRGICLIKGNHDNFIDRFKQPLNFEIYRQEALLGRYLFFHGEEEPASKDGEVLVMGHLHPAVAIYNKIGVKEKLRCFLYGKTSDGRRIIILPAMNYFAEGVDVNQDDVSEIAPIFKGVVNVDKLRALCLGEGEILDFGKVKDLRDLGR